MKGTDRIDKNGEGLFILLVDGPMWCAAKVKSLFKQAVKKYDPVDIVFSSILIPASIVLFIFALIYNVTWVLVASSVIVGVILLVFGITSWHDFIVRKKIEYRDE